MCLLDIFVLCANFTLIVCIQSVHIYTSNKHTGVLYTIIIFLGGNTIEERNTYELENQTVLYAHIPTSSANFTICYVLCSQPLFHSHTSRITTRIKLVSNVSVTMQWPSSVQYRQYNCMRINTARRKMAG